MGRSTKIFALFIMVPALFFTAALQTDAIPLRSITTVQWDYYLYDTPENGFRIEEAGIYRLDKLSLVAKVEWKNRSAFTEIKGMGGVVFNLFAYSYMETSYGVSKRWNEENNEEAGENIIAHHLLADFYHERESRLAIAGIKADLSSEEMSLQPSIAADWKALPGFSLWGKYITSFSNKNNFVHSFWGEGEYELSNKLVLNAGGTIGTFIPDMGEPSELEYSGLGGLSLKPVENLTITYGFQYKFRPNYNIVSNTLTGDVRF